MATTQSNGALGSKAKRRRVRGSKRSGAPQRAQPQLLDLQHLRTEAAELRSANRELLLRIAALESELGTARKQIELQRAELHPQPAQPEPKLEAARGGRSRRSRTFAAGVVASLLG